MLRITDRHDRPLLFGPTNEEQITQIFRDNVRSYKDLPRNLYHIQWKFRDEIRPRFGVMRGREFLMKDAYSFDVDEAGARRSYQKMFVAYLRTFERLGLQALPMAADTGPIGGDMSHEFIILAETGERARFSVIVIWSICRAPGPEVAYEDDLELVIARYTSMLMPPRMKNTTRKRLNNRCRKTSVCRPAALRLGTFFISATNTPRP